MPVYDAFSVDISSALISNNGIAVCRMFQTKTMSITIYFTSFKFEAYNSV